VGRRGEGPTVHSLMIFTWSHEASSCIVAPFNFELRDWLVGGRERGGRGEERRGGRTFFDMKSTPDIFS
jgi:hypothetical protein